MSDVLIEVKGLETRLGDFAVHEGLDLVLHRGEIVGLVGGSGAGKTALLRVILGFHTPTSGTVELFGRPIHSVSPEIARRLRGRCGVLFQSGALFSPLTVYDNVALPLREQGLRDEALICHLAYLDLQRVGLRPEVASLMPAELSGGMVKRVGLARALSLEPELLLLDEPTSGLDPISGDAFVTLLRGLHATLRFGMILITHDIDTLVDLCHRILVLADRHIVAEGTLDEVVASTHPYARDFFHGSRARRALAVHDRGQAMVSQARAILAGIFVVALIALLVVMASWLSGQRVEGDAYLVVSQTPVTGLLPHSRVLYRGLSAGQVESMRIDPSDAKNILIRIRLKREVPVTLSTYATLYLEGISGNRQILIQDTYRDRKRLGTSPAHPTRIPLRPPTLDVVAGLGERLVRSADRVSHQLERLLSDENQERIEGILDGVRHTLRGVTSLADEMGSAASKLGEAGERVSLEVTGKTLQRANLALEQLTEAAKELERVARALRENPQQMIGGPRPVQPGPGEQGHRRR